SDVCSSDLGDVLGNRDGVGVGRGAGVHRDIAARRDDAVEGAAVDDQVLDDGKRVGPERLDGDVGAVGELSHAQLARGAPALWAVGHAVDHQAAGAADAFTAVAFK